MHLNIIFQHFDSNMGSPESRLHGLDFTTLGMPVLDLSALDVCFFEDEIWNAIQALPPDKVLRPDGSSAWFSRVPSPSSRRMFS
jgi:hypothetical protein